MVAVGAGLTVTLTEVEAVQPKLVVTVTEYVPPCESWIFALVGF